MRKLLFSLLPSLACVMFFTACQEEVDLRTGEEAISARVIEQVAALGFNPDGIERIDEGYRVERDIIITHEMLETAPTLHQVPGTEQYSTANLVSVNGSREILVYAPEGGRRGFSASTIAAIDEAIARFNAENLQLSFRRVTSSKGKSAPNITFTRLGTADENAGVLGSAGFPSAGNPYHEVKLSGVLESRYGMSVAGIATVVAHELGHCIGFRHTDYFDRSISCGGSPANEGDGGVGAYHIPGTPTGASLQAASWMLSCTDGSNRPFNNDDKTALNYLY